MRMRSMPRGFMVIGIVLATAAAVWAFDDSQKPENNCVVCAAMAACPVMQNGVKPEIYNIQSGSAMLFTVTDPSRVAEFHQGWDQCKAVMDKAMKMSKSEAQSHLCQMCQGYYKLSHEGAEWDCVKTENGVLTLLTAKKAKVVAAIQTQAAAQRDCMAHQAAATASKEPAAPAAEKAGDSNTPDPEKEGNSNSP